MSEQAAPASKCYVSSLGGLDKCLRSFKCMVVCLEVFKLEKFGKSQSVKRVEDVRFLKGNGLKTVPQIFVSGIVEDTQIYVGDYTMFKESLNKGKG